METISKVFRFSSKTDLKCGDAYRDSGQYYDAAIMYRRFLAKNPNTFNVWVQLGHCYKESNLMNHSLWAYIQALNINTFDYDLWTNIGHFFKINNMITLARNAYIISIVCNNSIDCLSSDAEKELSTLGGFTLNIDVIQYMKKFTINKKDRKIFFHQKIFVDSEVMDSEFPFRMYENCTKLYDLRYELAVSQLHAPAIEAYFNIFSAEA